MLWAVLCISPHPLVERRFLVSTPLWMSERNAQRFGGIMSEEADVDEVVDDHAQREHDEDAPPATPQASSGDPAVDALAEQAVRNGGFLFPDLR